MSDTTGTVDLDAALHTALTGEAVLGLAWCGCYGGVWIVDFPWREQPEIPGRVLRPVFLRECVCHYSKTPGRPDLFGHTTGCLGPVPCYSSGPAASAALRDELLRPERGFMLRRDTRHNGSAATLYLPGGGEVIRIGATEEAALALAAVAALRSAA